MSSITPNIKYNKYQVKGKEHIYLFEFELLQEMKKHFSTRFDTPPEKVDEWYNNAPGWIKKKIQKVEIEKPR